MAKKYQVVAMQGGYRQRIGKPHTSLTEAEKKVKAINKKSKYAKAKVKYVNV